MSGDNRDSGKNSENKKWKNMLGGSGDKALFTLVYDLPFNPMTFVRISYLSPLNFPSDHSGLPGGS